MAQFSVQAGLPTGILGGDGPAGKPQTGSCLGASESCCPRPSFEVAATQGLDAASRTSTNGKGWGGVMGLPVGYVPRGDAELQREGAGQVDSITKFAGLDVSNETISVAVAQRGTPPPQYVGSVPNTPEAMSKLVRRLDSRTGC